MDAYPKKRSYNDNGIRRNDAKRSSFRRYQLRKIAVETKAALTQALEYIPDCKVQKALFCPGMRFIKPVML